MYFRRKSKRILQSATLIAAGIKPIWISENPDEHKEYEGIRITELKELLNYL